MERQERTLIVDDESLNCEQRANIPESLGHSIETDPAHGLGPPATRSCSPAFLGVSAVLPKSRLRD